jgi:hypothetical protein
MGESHAPDVVDMDFLDEIKPPYVRKVRIPVFLINEHSHVARVNNIAFEFLLVLGFLLLNFLNFLPKFASNVVLLRDLDFERDFFLIFGAGDRLDIWKGLGNILSQILCIFAATVHEHNMGRLDLLYKLSRLCAVSMGSEADFFDSEIDRDGLAVFHGSDAVSLLEVASDGPLCTVASDADSVFGIVAPSFKKGPGLSILKHTRCTHNHHGILLFGIDTGVLLQVVDMPVFERIGLHSDTITSSL